VQVPDPLPGIEVLSSEQITRFLTQRKWFNPRTENISPQAFSPRAPKPLSTIPKSSVYRTEGCSDEEIWLIGEKYVAEKRQDGQKVLARADVSADVILSSAGLVIEPAPTPHPRHADIVNWPDARERQLDKMNILAEQSKLRLPPPTSSHHTVDQI
jgi:hypothetical protein